jgi:hypothetical protein
MAQHTAARLTVHWNEVIDHFEHTNSPLQRITTDNGSSNWSMTSKLQSTLEASGLKWPAFRNDVPHLAHVIQLGIGAFLTSLGVQGCTMSLEAHEHNQQF